MDANKSEYQGSMYFYNQLIDDQTEKDVYFIESSQCQLTVNDNVDSEYFHQDAEVDDSLVKQVVDEKFSEFSMTQKSSVNDTPKKRDNKAVFKDVEEDDKTQDYLQKLQIRKKQNRVAAQKSRDRKKERVQLLESENFSLKYEYSKLKLTLNGYSEQLEDLRSSLEEIL